MLQSKMPIPGGFSLSCGFCTGNTPSAELLPGSPVAPRDRLRRHGAFTSMAVWRLVPGRPRHTLQQEPAEAVQQRGDLHFIPARLDGGSVQDFKYSWSREKAETQQAVQSE